MRPLEITRQEAEDLVDLLEANDAGNPSRSELARDLREKYGMVPRDRKGVEFVTTAAVAALFNAEFERAKT